MLHSARTTLAIALVCSWALVPGAYSEPVAAASTATTSNVVLIVLDDLGMDRLTFYAPELGPLGEPAWGKPYPCTPNLQRLREEGILFTSCTTSPICSPTRAEVLTGRYGFRTGIGDAIDAACNGGLESLHDDEILLSELLQDGWGWYALDVACGAFGKWHVSCANDYCHPTDNGFDVFQGHMGNNLANSGSGGHFSWDYVDEPGMGGTCSGNPPTTETTWDAQKTLEDTLAWIDGLSSGRPFFAYVNFNPPHGPFEVPPFDLLSQETQDLMTALDLEEGQRPNESSPSTEMTKVRRIAIHNAVVEAVDALIGELVDDLPSGTTVIVLDDNGTDDLILDLPPTKYPTGHGKRTPYQLGVRVPLIVWGDRVHPDLVGAKRSDLVDSVDLWRTVANLLGLTDTQIDTYLAGLSPSPVVDSLSFLDLIESPSASSQRDISFTEMFGPNQGGHEQTSSPFEPTAWYGIATDGQYKLIRFLTIDWQQNPVQVTTTEEFYDLSQDLQEEDNLCGSDCGNLTGDAATAYAALAAEVDALSTWVP